MPQDDNELTQHNGRWIGQAANEFVELAARAITKKSHGSLTLKFEWRAHGANRFVLTEEQSEMCLAHSADQ